MKETGTPHIILTKGNELQDSNDISLQHKEFVSKLGRYNLSQLHPKLLFVGKTHYTLRLKQFKIF